MDVPKYPADGVYLIDRVERNREVPATFLIPSQFERGNAKIGEFVKIGLEREGLGAERFWVEIKSRVDDGRYIGRIDNDLADGWGVNYNDLIVFEPRHVLSTQ